MSTPVTNTAVNPARSIGPVLGALAAARVYKAVRGQLNAAHIG